MLLPWPIVMALDLTVWQMLGVSVLVMVALLLIAYGIAGWHERRARSRRERKAETMPTLTPFDLPRAIAITVLTLGVYLWVLIYRNTQQIQVNSSTGFKQWEAVFWGWVSLDTLAVVFMIVTFVDETLWLLILYYALGGLGYVAMVSLGLLNWLKFRDMAKEHHAADDTLFWVSIVLFVVLWPLGAIVWAINWNRTLERMGSMDGTAATQVSFSTA